MLPTWWIFSLGEGDLPPTPGVLDKSVRAFMNMDTAAVPGIWTYKDYRAVPEDQNVFFKQYKYMTFWGADKKVTVYWGKLPKEIKSAWFEDNINSALVRVNMLEQESVELTNPAIDKYFIKVTYDKSASSVVENDVFAEALISPNPATDYINIKNDNVDSFEIFNSMGDIVMAKESSKNVIISSLPAGSYFIKIHLSDGKVLTEKFIKH